MVAQPAAGQAASPSASKPLVPFVNGTTNDPPVSTSTSVSFTPVAMKGASVPRFTPGMSPPWSAKVAVTPSFCVMKLTSTFAVPVPAMPAMAGAAESASSVPPIQKTERCFHESIELRPPGAEGPP